LFRDGCLSPVPAGIKSAPFGPFSRRPGFPARGATANRRPPRGLKIGNTRESASMGSPPFRLAVLGSFRRMREGLFVSVCARYFRLFCSAHSERPLRRLGVFSFVSTYEDLPSFFCARTF